MIMSKHEENNPQSIHNIYPESMLKIKPKVLVVITDKGNLQEHVYIDIKELDFTFEESHIIEIIVTDRRGSTHHYPKEHYDFEVYAQVQNFTKNNQVPFFNGYKPNFYFNPKQKGETK